MFIDSSSFVLCINYDDFSVQNNYFKVTKIKSSMRNTGVSLLYYIPIAFYNVKLLQDSVSACVYTHLYRPPPAALYSLYRHVFYLLKCFF